VFPKQFAIALGKTNYSLCSGNLSTRERVAAFGTAGNSPVHDKDPAINDGWAGISSAKRHAPANDGAIRRELLDQPILAPNAVTFGAEPLRPIVGVKKWEGNEKEDERKRQAHDLV
jgi:hypothetical protein